MQTIETTIDIDATPRQVWATLTEFDTYADWNPFITAVAGSPEEGARLRIHVQPPEGRRMGFKPRITAVDPEKRLEWLGKLGIRGLFDGRHEFTLDTIAGRGTRLVHRETFSGLLVGLLLDETDIRRGFEAMNTALKERTEATVTHQADAEVAA